MTDILDIIHPSILIENVSATILLQSPGKKLTQPEDRNYLYRLGPTEYALSLRAETQSSSRNVVLNKNKTRDNVQKVNHSKDLEASEFCLDMKNFKHQAQNFLPQVGSATPPDICQRIQDYVFGGCYPNIETTLRIVLLCLYYCVM
jgi:hypothetical protein